jgi:hypothetical protein
MKYQPQLSNPDQIRLYNVIDMALTFSAMIRLFNKGTKDKLRDRIALRSKDVFHAQEKEEFINIHSNFCRWGIENICLAEKKRNGQVIKPAAPASYGQIAKTFDVTLKVVIYYSHLPDCERSQKIAKWLNAAIDTKMMAMIREYYGKDLSCWPTTIEQVDQTTYKTLQAIVRRFIKEKHNNEILPVQFDDIYWNLLNR